MKDPPCVWWNIHGLVYLTSAETFIGVNFQAIAEKHPILMNKKLRNSSGKFSSILHSPFRSFLGKKFYSYEKVNDELNFSTPKSQNF